MTENVGAQHDPRPPRVLLLYYTYTGQALRVLEAAGEVFTERGWDVRQARIEFTDRRFAERFSRFPLRRAPLDLLAVLPAQARRVTAEIQTPSEVRDGDYDLVCIGSSTWWFTMNMPMRTFLRSEEARELLAGTPFAAFCVCRRYWRGNFRMVRKLGEKHGGRYLGGVHFEYLGGQLASGLSLISYLQTGDTAIGCSACPFRAPTCRTISCEQTRNFAVTLADQLTRRFIAGLCGSTQPDRVHEYPGGRQPRQQRVTHRRGGGEHAAQVGEPIAIERQRQSTLAEQHRSTRCTRRAAARRSPGNGRPTSWWCTSRPCNGRASRIASPGPVARLRDGC